MDVGLKLRKQIELRQNGAAENYSDPSASNTKVEKFVLKGSQWPLRLPEA